MGFQGKFFSNVRVNVPNLVYIHTVNVLYSKTWLCPIVCLLYDVFCIVIFEEHYIKWVLYKLSHPGTDLGEGPGGAGAPSPFRESFFNIFDL